MANCQFLTRVNSYPLVGDTWENACYYYNLAKNCNTIFGNLSESSVIMLTVCSKPLMSQYEQRITAIDSTLCKVLNYIEKTYPNIKEPSDVVIGDGKRALQPHLDTIMMPYNVVKKSATTCYEMGSKTMEAGKKAMDDLQENGRDITKNILCKLDVCMQHFLPEDIEMKDLKEFTGEKQPSNDNLQQHAATILSRVQERLYSRYKRNNFNLYVNMDWVKQNITNTYYIQALLRMEEGLSNEFWQKLEKIKTTNKVSDKSEPEIAALPLCERLMFYEKNAVLKAIPLLFNTNNVAKVLFAMFYERLNEQQQQKLQVDQSMVTRAMPVQTESEQSDGEPVWRNVCGSLNEHEQTG